MILSVFCSEIPAADVAVPASSRLKLPIGDSAKLRGVLLAALHIASLTRTAFDALSTACATVTDAQSTTSASSGGSVQLPAVLVSHIASFLQDAHSLLNLQSSCKAWRAHKFDAAYKRLYLDEFEAESAHDPVIAADGGATPWRARYAARRSVQSRRHGG